MTIPPLILAGTCLVMAFGHVLASRPDGTGAALLGASLMVAGRTLTFDEAIARLISAPSHCCSA